MKEHTTLDDKERQLIVESYQRGQKIHEIEERFNISRSTIYWVLEQAHVTPDRLKRGVRMAADGQQVAQLYALIEAQDKRIKELEAALAKAQTRLSRAPR